MMDKLLNTDKTNYKNILLVIDDLVGVLLQKYSYQEANYEDSINLDLTNIELKTAADPEVQAERFSRKIQFLEDAHFLREFNSFQQAGTQSLIPTELKILLKCLNESVQANESYPSKIQKKEELIEFIESQIEKMNQKIENSFLLV